MKIDDIVQVWNGDARDIQYIGWGKIVGVGLGLMSSVLLVEVENKLIWTDKLHCIPERKAFEIAKRIEKDLE